MEKGGICLYKNQKIVLAIQGAMPYTDFCSGGKWGIVGDNPTNIPYLRLRGYAEARRTVRHIHQIFVSLNSEKGR